MANIILKIIYVIFIFLFYVLPSLGVIDRDIGTASMVWLLAIYLMFIQGL